jgi:XTP/dITP diphosphohydrolase
LRLVLATFNRDKARELASLLARPGLELVPIGDLVATPPPEETGATLEENARLKAEAAMRATGLPAIADDTGLEVDALDGAPGIYAARFAGPGATYADNVRLLLERLREVPEARRTARFRTVCAACFPDGAVEIGEGVLEGRIAEVPRGSAGFGYDPVFEPEGSSRTLAEMSAEEKDRVSHRGRAARALGQRIASRTS